MSRPFFTVAIPTNNRVDRLREYLAMPRIELQ
jgi:hypothetical protein